MVKKYIGLVAIAFLGLVGCQTHNMDKTSLVMITKSLGTKQCSEVNADNQLQQLKRELEQANIKVFAAEIGTDQMSHIALCGADDGKIAIFKIRQASVISAENMGYKIK
ncbi:hypothetical protein SAMN05421732_104117 [Acinetobacter kookii]|uniref:Lipoprotein n=2 Tax=Acinetobacter kookii TaxID=1226327 RepID=A0A1G6JYZ5_9GAMM|nr:hypothetical protein SAMN05421732_104117 [Acinetobacter kookii]